MKDEEKRLLNDLDSRLYRQGKVVGRMVQELQELDEDICVYRKIIESVLYGKDE